ncbi:uncharacterized protein LOC116129580 [Pistacia vera]|uniref:uncharacterized protein LOC116129580 n=1 Tax=Pistacia vera TaxID=55513 RepID=UPI00126320EC|nr:uncharacterized protein LOC116129580 [Pistacia vera]XP_031271159.1 uncharacterized protein LOC116129580 [Pistacia vera]
MSDHVIQSDHDGDRMRRQPMHLYQSVWMAHWTQTSCNSETRDDRPLSFHCQCKEDDCDSKQHGPEIQSGISKHAKEFGEVPESRTDNIMDENLKLSSIKSGKEILQSQFFPKFSLSKKESTMPLKNVSTYQGAVPEMGTSGECHFQHEGVTGDQEQRVKSPESLAKKSLAVSTSFQHDLGSSSKIVPYRYNSRKPRIHSLCRQEEINQTSPVVASEEHFRNSKFQSCSTSLVHDKKIDDLLDFRRSGTSSSRQNNMHLLLHEPSASNNQLPVFVGKKIEKRQNHSGATLFPNWSNPIDATKTGTSFNDFFSVPRIPRSLDDVETMRICTTEGHPKFSETTHHFLITKKTDVNSSKGSEMFKEKMFGKFLSLSPDFGFSGQQGVKLQPLGSTTDSEEKKNIGDIKTSAVCLKNESSADTDTMDMDVFQKNHFSVVVSSPTNEVIVLF